MFQINYTYFIAFRESSEDTPAATSTKPMEALPHASGESKHILGTVSKKSKKEEAESVQMELKAKLGGIFLVVSSADGDLTNIIVGGKSDRLSCDHGDCLLGNYKVIQRFRGSCRKSLEFHKLVCK